MIMRETGDWSLFCGSSWVMDVPQIIGLRGISRDFEEDRYSEAVLAMAFERLAVAGDSLWTDFDSVQNPANSAVNQPLLLEAIR